MSFPLCPHCGDSIQFAEAKISVTVGTVHKKMDAVYCVRCQKIITVLPPPDTSAADRAKAALLNHPKATKG